jgi:hypothetical protein
MLGDKKARIKILLQVAKEMESMLYHSSINEIKQECIKRYFSRINRIISQFPGVL